MLKTVTSHINPDGATAPAVKAPVRKCSDIGHTPVADLTCMISQEAQAAGIQVFVKKEFENPGLSHKDRIAMGIIDAAEARGDLETVLPSGERVKKTVVAASSGNTGNSIAWVARQKGFEVIIITNSKCSDEKQADIRSKGATLLISDDLYALSRVPLSAAGDNGTRQITPDEVAQLSEEDREDLAKCTVTKEVAQKLGWYKEGIEYPYYTTDYMLIEEIMAASNPKFHAVMQYDNLDNFQAHYDTLAREIYNNVEGGCRITDFVFAGSTCGTITGVGTYLREQDPNIKVVLADPVGSRLRYYLKGGLGDDMVVPGYCKTRIEGAGKCQSTGIMRDRCKMNRTLEDGTVVEDWVIDPEAVVVPDEDSTLMMHKLRLQQGLWVGSSSGLNMQAVVMYADELVKKGLKNRKIFSVLCDPGFKYESKFYNDEWLAKNNLPLYSDSVKRWGPASEPAPAGLR